jgi:hypothetical protein
VLGKDRLSHIGRHIVLRQRGVKDIVHEEGTQVSTYILFCIAGADCINRYQVVMHAGFAGSHQVVQSFFKA